MVSKALFRFQVGEIHLKHEFHLFLFKIGRKIKKAIRLINFHYNIVVK